MTQPQTCTRQSWLRQRLRSAWLHVLISGISSERGAAISTSISHCMEAANVQAAFVERKTAFHATGTPRTVPPATARASYLAYSFHRPIVLWVVSSFFRVLAEISRSLEHSLEGAGTPQTIADAGGLPWKNGDLVEPHVHPAASLRFLTITAFLTSWFALL